MSSSPSLGGNSNSRPIPDQALIRSSGAHGSKQYDSTAAILDYLRERVPEFSRLLEIRQRGWESSKGDAFFRKQRQTADEPSEKTAKFFYGLIPNPFPHKTAILDLCMAPGGFLSTAMKCNPDASVVAFSLPVNQGGHKVLLPWRRNLQLHLLDITMLATDMGQDITSIPANHPDKANFLPRKLDANQRFDLVICDGQALRTQERAEYRARKEGDRLASSQLALGLDHVRDGGTLVVLLHKVEAWRNIKILHTFSQISFVQVYKPKGAHAKRSSFYLVAKDIQRDSIKAIRAIETWRNIWAELTFGGDSLALWGSEGSGQEAKVLLTKFGPDLIRLGREVWQTQGKALAKASFMRGGSAENKMNNGRNK